MCRAPLAVEQCAGQPQRRVGPRMGCRGGFLKPEPAAGFIHGVVPKRAGLGRVFVIGETLDTIGSDRPPLAGNWQGEDQRTARPINPAVGHRLALDTGAEGDRNAIARSPFFRKHAPVVGIRNGRARRFNFHALRHSALTNLYRRTRDIRVVQRVARHKSVDTTTISAAPTDEDILRAVRELPC